MAMSSFTVISATVDNERDGSTLIGRRNSEQVPEYHNYHSNHINLNDEGTDVITINVAGKRFETYRDNLEQFPQTLMGDRVAFDRYYNIKNNEYFFDRNQMSFPAILYFYQSGGIVYVPNTVPKEIHLDELDFFKIPYKGKSKSAPPPITTKASEEEGFHEQSRLQEIRWKIWEFLECPESSAYSRVWALLDVAIILLSILTVILESMPELKSEKNMKIFSGIDTFCVAFFTFDFTIRLILCPSFTEFAKIPLNILDCLAIMPFYLELAVGQLVKGGALTTFKVLRIFRIMRGMKLIRHSKRLILMGRVIQDCMSELTLLLIIWLMGVLTFGTIMYYIEGEQDKGFDSILHSCWWAVVTISTVGYGDMTPHTGLGKLVGSCLLFISMVYLALPMTVIVSKFNKAFERFKEDETSSAQSSINDNREYQKCVVSASQERLQNHDSVSHQEVQA